MTGEDPFRWLEDDTDDVRTWEAAQDDVARAHLDAWEHQERLKQLIAACTPAAAGSGARPAGRWSLTMDRSPHGAAPRLLVREADEAQPQILLDLGPEASGRPLGVDQLAASPDGRWLVVGVSPAGSEQATLRVVDLESRACGAARLEHAARSVIAWLPDSSGFYWSAGVGPESETMQRCLRHHRVGDDASTLVDLELAGRTWVHPQVSPTYAAAVVYEGNFLPRPWYVRRHDDPGGTWATFLREGPAMVHGTFVDDEYVAVVIDGAANGHVAAIPVRERPDPSTWRTILAESDLCLRGLAHLGGGLLLVTGLRDGDWHAVVVTLAGEVRARIAPPEDGSCVFPAPDFLHPASTSVGAAAPAPAAVGFGHSHVHRSLTQFAVDLGSGAVTRVGDRAIDLSHRVVWERRRTVSADGCAIPYDVYRRRDLEPDRPHPALIYGYGGFNVPIQRDYDPLKAAFVLSGGVLAIPHLRGGGEYGWRWWHDGRRDRKQHAFDDLYAVAEDLVRTGVTTPRQLGLYGISNGGLLAAVAVTQRPDLFGAVASLVPVCDLLRIGRDPWGWFRCAPEYGDPDDPDEAQWLAAYSPYHHVTPGQAHPPTLVVSADADTRAYPWHARKFAAALQAAGSDAPALLLTLPADGHFAALNPANQHLWLGFLMRHTGLEPADPAQVRATT
ncbi:MAG TPA: prolyl oligopeptidase family serine peptidase [Nitriliruptorales bacterium]